MGHRYVIRQATEADCEAIFRLIMELAVFEKAPEQVKNTVEGLKRDGFGEKSFFSCLVAETDEDETSQQGKVVIGYAMYYFGYSTWSGRLVYLEDLCVSSGHRGAGVGTALMKRVAGIGAEVGCVRMQFVVLGWNTGARKLYDRLGAQDLTESEDWHVSTIRNETFIKVAKDSTNISNDHIRIIA